MVEECVLEVYMGDHIDRNIDELWDRVLSWPDHIKSLDAHITMVRFDPTPVSRTFIYFSDPEYKSWFILRWS